MAEEKYRVQFDFTGEALSQLDELKLNLRATNRAEVIRQALRIMQWLIETLRGGGRILVERNGQVQSVVFPFLAGEVTQSEANRPVRVAAR